ncbi:MAG: methyl-accepting chemotaxis protein [Oscillospiraceae bacterium]|nr:methyl-accepting chemotaxis protein [Oscillospiraceae bacterium]
MKNFKVAKKLMVGFLIVIVFAVIIGTVGIIGMMQINSGSDDIFYNQLVPINEMGFAQEYFQRMRVQIRNIAINSGDTAAVNQFAALFEEREANFLLHFNEFRPFLVTETGIRAAYEIEVLFRDEFMPGIREVIAGARAGLPTHELMDIMASTTLAADQISAQLANIMELRLNAAESTAVSNANLYLTLLIATIILLIVAVVISVLLALYISGLISKPLAPLATFFTRAAETGDILFDKREQEAVDRYKENKDEIGQLSSAISDFMHEINHEMNMLSQVADGDLTISPNTLSDKDMVGKALSKVVDNLNNMFSEINVASNQVSTGSQQIADGAQTLAQGSTEQAATVEELSASTSEIADQTKANAEMANKAADLAGTIKVNAEKGSRQMDEMVTAVNEISAASQSISKVIKVIDDIAFQTNILALNAAVEAARAGQHGKGFAVVADEVRTLAAKSAEAAKDTGVLISNSMEKAEHGARIAKDTADSLIEIVSGINESTEIISDIARSSEVQSSGITQINSGIDQVATVVQQNSATAEESAAAAEELSSQSSMLESLIAQFKLKNAGGRSVSHAPSASAASANTGFSMDAHSKY